LGFFVSFLRSIPLAIEKYPPAEQISNCAPCNQNETIDF